MCLKPKKLAAQAIPTKDSLTLSEQAAKRTKQTTIQIIHSP